MRTLRLSGGLAPVAVAVLLIGCGEAPKPSRTADAVFATAPTVEDAHPVGPTDPTPVRVSPPSTDASPAPSPRADHGGRVTGRLDEAAAQSVVSRLDRLDADALRAYRHDGDLGEEVIDLVRSAYASPAWEVRLQSLRRIHDGESDVEFADPLTGRDSEVEELLEVRDDCVHLRLTVHRDGKLADPPAPSRSYAVLRVAEASEANPTGWSLAWLYTPPDGDPEEGLCDRL